MVLIPAYLGSLFQQEYFLHKENKLFFFVVVKVVKAVVACRAPRMQLLALWIHDLTEVGWGCSAKPCCGFLCRDTRATRRDTGTNRLLKDIYVLALSARSGGSSTDRAGTLGRAWPVRRLKDLATGVGN